MPNAAKIWENLQKEHCTPAQSAETAKRANVKQLVLTHFLPKMNPEKALAEAAEVFSGKIYVPNDLDVIQLPVKTSLSKYVKRKSYVSILSSELLYNCFSLPIRLGINYLSI